MIKLQKQTPCLCIQAQSNTLSFTTSKLNAHFQRCFSDAEGLQLESCLSVARECGLDETAVKEYITNPENQNAVVNKALRWSEKRLSG